MCLNDLLPSTCMYFFMYCIQQCFICHSPDFTVSEDAGIEPRSAEFMNTISLRFLAIILRIVRLGVSICNVYIKNQKPLLLGGWGGGGGDCDQKEGKLLRIWSPNTSRNSASGLLRHRHWQSGALSNHALGQDLIHK